MVKTEVLVKLVAPDPWSFTVLDALRRKFGFTDIVDVERTKSWELSFDLVSPDAALALTKELLRTTVLLANPNRDIWALRCGPGDLPAGFWCSDTDQAETFVVRVTDTDDIVGSSVAQIMRCRLGMDSLRSVRFSTVWGLRISRAASDPRGIAARASTAKTWRSGLLANPHSQEAEVYGVGDYLAWEGDR
jgi:phosphoribosylformylglycinamidine (FGAM) synthase PurS component